MDLDTRIEVIAINREKAETLFPWLVDCQYQNGHFYLTHDGYGDYLIWESGIFESGIWERGTMIDCEFYGGEMKLHSRFINGTWHNGVFRGFEVRNSTWYNGDFKHGYFIKSKFLNGKFDGGVFEASSQWLNGGWGKKSLTKYKNCLYDKIPNKLKIGKRMAKKIRKKLDMEKFDKALRGNEITNTNNINTVKRGRGRPRKVIVMQVDTPAPVCVPEPDRPQPTTGVPKPNKEKNKTPKKALKILKMF